jgi:hypothetical protein
MGKIVLEEFHLFLGRPRIRVGLYLKTQFYFIRKMFRFHIPADRRKILFYRRIRALAFLGKVCHNQRRLTFRRERPRVQQQKMKKRRLFDETNFINGILRRNVVRFGIDGLRPRKKRRADSERPEWRSLVEKTI